jgi:hypothetical protein
MKFPAGSSVARIAVPALAALLGGAFLAPSPVRAECGDYVMFGPGAAAHRGGQAPTPHEPVAPGGKHAPCSGPMCSRGPMAPPPAPASAPVRAGEWAHLVSLPPDVDAGAMSLLTQSSNSRPVHRPSAVYHPPR